jgi:hypothetical protein
MKNLDKSVPKDPYYPTEVQEGYDLLQRPETMMTLLFDLLQISLISWTKLAKFGEIMFNNVIIWLCQ